MFRKNVCLDDKFIDKLFIFTKNPKKLKACNPVKIGTIVFVFFKKVDYLNNYYLLFFYSHHNHKNKT